MADTTNLQLPLLAAAQAQKHVTHNDALLRLDALVQLSVKDRDLTAPPGAPGDGDRYIPASGATGGWAGWDWNIAWYSDGVWTKLAPREGWRAWVEDEDVALVWDGAAWIEIQAGGAGRELLTAARTYFVNGSTGNDGNDGLASGTAFATIQKAIDVAASLDLGIFDVIIQVAAGTYAASNQLKSLVGAGKAIIVGDEATPSNVTISVTGGECFRSEPIRGTYALRGMKLATISSGNCIGVQGAGLAVEIQNLDFGVCAGQHINSRGGAHVLQTGNYSISGGGVIHWHAVSGKIECQSFTISVTGTPAFSNAFARAQLLGLILAGSTVFSGSATGKRYDVVTNSSIYTGGGGAAFLPGDSAGTAATGGQYV